MFFHEEEIEIVTPNSFITKTLTYTEFKNLFNEFRALNLNGYGMLSHKKDEQFQNFFIHANDFIFGFSNTSDAKMNINSKCNISSYFLMDNKILNKLELFTGNEQATCDFYKDFGVSIPVDVKFYEYSEETKIMISKTGDGNIDLYMTFLLNHKNGNDFQIKLNSNINNIIKHLKLAKILAERLEKK